MMNVVRSMPMYFRPYIDFSFQTPYASAILWSSSGTSSNGRLNFSINFAWDFSESGLTPRTTASLLVIFLCASRSSHDSTVQPGVLSFG